MEKDLGYIGGGGSTGPFGDGGSAGVTAGRA